jgi:Mg2+ and Co2+ transporter CorA
MEQQRRIDDNDLYIKVARLEEKLEAADKALNLSQHLMEMMTNNTHAIVAEIISIIATIVSLYAVFHK